MLSSDLKCCLYAKSPSLHFLPNEQIIIHVPQRSYRIFIFRRQYEQNTIMKNALNKKREGKIYKHPSFNPIKCQVVNYAIEFFDGAE